MIDPDVRPATSDDVAQLAWLEAESRAALTDQRGGEDWLFGGHIVASNGMLHEDVRGSLAELKGL